MAQPLSLDIVADFAPASHTMRAILDRVARIAPTEASVLVQGETGVGKATLARRIHQQSKRANGPFIHAFCASYAEDEILPALFGRATQNGLGEQRVLPGLLERARGGTLFLDDVDELAHSVQGRLVETFRSSRFQPPGDGTTVRADLRVLAASSRGLEAAVADGRFLPDLFQYLTRVRIRLPALRERREDIPALVAHFVKHFSHLVPRRLRALHPHFNDEACQRLMYYYWPGNVQELSNVVKQALIFSSHASPSVLTIHDLARADFVPDSVRRCVWHRHVDVARQ